MRNTMGRYDGYDYTKDDQEMDTVRQLIKTNNKRMKKIYEEYLETLEDRKYLRDKPYWRG